MDAISIKHVLEERLVADVRVRRDPIRHADLPSDLAFDVRLEDDVWVFAVELKSALGRSLNAIARAQADLRRAAPGVVPILAVSRVSAQERVRLREKGVNHMASRGDLWIRHRGLHVHVEGKLPVSSSPRRGRGPNIFSKRASLVPRVLLHSVPRVWGVRELAEEAGLSVGYASDVLKSMAAAGYASFDAEGYRLSDASLLLRHWSARYSWVDNVTYSFVAPYEKEELLNGAIAAASRSGHRPVLSMLSAMDVMMPHVSHDQAHIYVEEYSPALERALRKQLHVEPVPEGGNLHVQLPYHGRAALYGAQRIDDWEVVSDIQLFLDLVHYPIRGAEAAEFLLRRKLGPRLGLSRAGLRALNEALGL